jgi:hypothetical protein
MSAQNPGAQNPGPQSPAGGGEPPYYAQPLPPQNAPSPYTPSPYAPNPYLPPPSSPSPFLAAPAPIASRFWIRTEYLLWWTKGAPAPPLVTVGSDNDPNAGALGQPGTRVVYGGENIDLGATSGLRLGTGFWLDQNQTYGIGGTFFILGKQSAGFSGFSDLNGSPVIARPAVDVQTGNPFAYVDSYPGSIVGGIVVNTTSQFYGLELNGTGKIVQTDQLRLDGLVGIRYLNLTESLRMDDQLYPLFPGALTFLGQPFDPANTIYDFDSYKTTNNFYGGQLGARLIWTRGPWSLEGVQKLALGATLEHAILNGSTAMVTPSGAATVATGGVLNTTANIGTYNQTRFAVAPETDLNLNFALTPRLSFRLGYSFIFWSNVARPGDQVNRTVNPSLVPTDVTYGQGGPNAPKFEFQTTSYWAQGLNLGFDFHF